MDTKNNNILSLKIWEIQAIKDGYKNVIITDEEIIKEKHLFVDKEDNELNFEIIETSPCKINMLSDMDAFLSGLSSTKELKEILRVKFGVNDDSIVYINRIKLI